NNASFNFTVGLFTFGSDGIKFVDENDSRCILFGFFKSLAQIALGLAGELAHNFGTVNEEEKCTSFVSHGSSNQGLAGTRRAIEQNTTRGLHANGFEECGMT